MRWTKSLAHRFRSLWRVTRADAELDGELAFHVEEQAKANIAAGMGPREAREAALREFGGVAQIREECRDERGVSLFYDFGRDVRLALRQVRRSPAFSAVIVLSLALGIGANAAIFTLVHTILVQQLPVSNPEQLFRLGDEGTCCVYGGLQGKFSIFSYPLYKELRDHTPQFSQLAAFQAGLRSVSVRREGSSQAADARIGQFISGNYFTTFGVAPAAGRLIVPEDDAPGAPPVVAISYRNWLRNFGLDPSIVGSGVVVNGTHATVVGVAAPDFYGETMRPDPPDFWIPLSAEPALHAGFSLLDQPDQSWLYSIGRLRSDADLAHVQAQLTGELQQWLAAHPEIGRDSPSERPQQRIVLSSGSRGVTIVRDRLSGELKILFAVSGLMLLIACANIANLLLARGAAYRGQTAIHLAMGASRMRLVRQALTSAIVLALGGGVVALYVAYAGSQALLVLLFRNAARMPIDTTPSPIVLGFALLLSLAAAAVFGMAPAWLNSRGDPSEALRGSGRGGLHAGFSRKTLVAFQVALSLVLLAGAGLFTASLNNLQNQRFGFETQGRLAFRVNSALAGYRVEQLSALYAQMDQRLSRIPGVLRASYSLYSPMEGTNWATGIAVEGRPYDSRDNASWNRVSANYFDVVGTRVVRGRAIGLQDSPDSTRVAVVNEAFVHKFLAGVDPIGKHMGSGDATHVGDFEIVGVVEDAKYTSARELANPMFFLPYLQMVDYQAAEDRSIQLRSSYFGAIEVHYSGAQGEVEQAVRRSLADIDPNMLVLRVLTFEQQVSGNFALERTIARLTVLFGGLALLLSGIGLYGLMAHRVTQRTSEIGLRIALGASRGQMLWMILREVLLLLLAGVAVGIPAALLATRATASLLYGLAPGDPLVLACAVAVLSVAALLAGFLPARRASRVDPMTALRYE